MNIRTAILLPLLALPSTLPAVPHISGKYIQGQPKDYVHKIPDIRELRAARMSPSAIQRSIAATGTKKIAVILTEFPSASSKTTSGYPTISTNTVIPATLAQVASYFQEVSYNQLTLSFDILATTYTADFDMSYYGYPDKADVLISEIIQKAGVYRGIGAGKYDAVMLVHAGFGNESTSSTDNGDIWSAHYTFNTVNGFSEGLVVSEFENGAYTMGVVCHEMGHMLGLPDLYATDSRSDQSQVGYWDLMDMGTWAGYGASPNHPGAWCKSILGWISPVTVTPPASISLSPAETSQDAVKILVATAKDPDKEYFLLEYRKKAVGTYDAYIPGDGLLIWHVDDANNYALVEYQKVLDTRFNHNIINNSYLTEHRGVEIATADGIDPSSPSGGGQDLGEPTNAWPGTRINFISPYSDSFAGQPSGISASGIKASGGKMNASLLKTVFTSSVDISKVINYPNPAGPAYPVSSSKPAGTLTTISMQYTRPPKKISVSIYNITGELVRDVDTAGINFRGEIGGPTRDYKWVYEYDWDGKNGSGDAAVDGTYFYRVKADDQIKTGKLAIVK